MLRLRPDVVYLKPLPFLEMVTPNTTLTTNDRIVVTYFWGTGHDYSLVTSDQLWFVERARAPAAFTKLVPWWCSRHVNTFKAWGPEIDFGTMLNRSQLYVDKRRNIQFAVARAAEVPEVTLDCKTFQGHWRWAPERKDPEVNEVGRFWFAWPPLSLSSLPSSYDPAHLGMPGARSRVSGIRG